MARGRYLTLWVVVLAAMALSCTMLFPPVDGGDSGDDTYSVAFDAPLGSRVVPSGTLIGITWHAYVDADASATLSVLVRHTGDRENTDLETNIPLNSGRSDGSLTWDTAEFSGGVYIVRAQVLVDGVVKAESDASGEITIDGIPEFEFTAPSKAVTLESGGLVEIAWTAFDPDETGEDGSGKEDTTAKIGVDLDLNHASGNEVYIYESTLAVESADETFEWDGTDLDDNAADPGVYYVFALIDDTINSVLTVDATGTIEVAEEEEEEEEEVAVGIISPEDDIEFLTAGDPLEIEYGVNKSSDTLVDLRIDTDDNHANGNETTVVLQRLIEADTETAVHEWDGNDYRGVAVDDGIYTPIVSVSSGSSAATTVAGEALIYVRRGVAREVSGQTWERASGKWSLVESDDPPPPARRDATLAYDTANDRVVLFGGRDVAGTAYGDTWTWDGDNWANLGVAGPDARYAHAVAYDSDRGKLVLFGGFVGGVPNGETWEWDGTTWTRLAPANAPSARSGHAMTYDAEREEVVLFGGQDAGGLSQQTWTWNGTDWTLKSPANSPSQRHAHGMAYDSSRDVLVLFGGTTPAGTAGDVWEWDGTNWSDVTPAAVEPEDDEETSPGNRHSHAMVYDGLHSQVAVFAGNDGAVTRKDTWLWDGTQWTDGEMSGILASRQNVGMTYDSDRRRVVSFGGAVGAPLIALLTPAAEQDITAGNSLSISWRDDDPTNEAKITLRVCNDEDPASATIVREILTDREAQGDGVLDIYNWQVPQLNPGVYYIFAYISQQGATPADPQSVAPGRLIVPDPTQP
ncbi:MAG: hypothetical protein JXO22_00945 [Phycisphaerae bacterium]|nr:hypothetical protein [Phycisphaerae bacterium]